MKPKTPHFVFFCGTTKTKCAGPAARPFYRFLALWAFTAAAGPSSTSGGACCFAAPERGGAGPGAGRSSPHPAAVSTSIDQSARFIAALPSVQLAGDHLAAVARAEGAVGAQVDRVAEEAHRPVGEQEVAPAGVVAAEGVQAAADQPVGVGV